MSYEVERDIATVLLWTKPDHHGASAVVNLAHAQHLGVAAVCVALVDAYLVDPDWSVVVFPAAHVAEERGEIFFDREKGGAVEDDGFLLFFFVKVKTWGGLRGKEVSVLPRIRESLVREIGG